MWVHQAIHRFDDIAYGADRLELFGGDLLAGLALDVVDQVDGVDAVDFQVLIQIGFKADALGVEFEEFDQRIAQGLEARRRNRLASIYRLMANSC